MISKVQVSAFWGAVSRRPPWEHIFSVKPRTRTWMVAVRPGQDKEAFFTLVLGCRPSNPTLYRGVKYLVRLQWTEYSWIGIRLDRPSSKSYSIWRFVQRKGKQYVEQNRYRIMPFDGKTYLLRSTVWTDKIVRRTYWRKIVASCLSVDAGWWRRSDSAKRSRLSRRTCQVNQPTVFRYLGIQWDLSWVGCIRCMTFYNIQPNKYHIKPSSNIVLRTFCTRQSLPTAPFAQPKPPTPTQTFDPLLSTLTRHTSRLCIFCF